MQYHGMYGTQGLYRQGICTGDCYERTHCMLIWAEGAATAREVVEDLTACNPDLYIVGAIPCDDEGTLPDFLTEWATGPMRGFRVFFRDGCMVPR